MSVTNEERRHAVEFLRTANCSYVACADCQKVSAALFGKGCENALCNLDDCSDSKPWRRLADLIEPEEQTCHMIRDHLTDTVFCDVCGERFDGVAQYMAMGPNGFSPADYKAKYKDANFCPNCGAKVVEVGQ